MPTTHTVDATGRSTCLPIVLARCAVRCFSQPLDARSYRDEEQARQRDRLKDTNSHRQLPPVLLIDHICRAPDRLSLFFPYIYIYSTHSPSSPSSFPHSSSSSYCTLSSSPYFFIFSSYFPFALSFILLFSSPSHSTERSFSLSLSPFFLAPLLFSQSLVWFVFFLFPSASVNKKIWRQATDSRKIVDRKGKGIRKGGK